MFSFTYLRARGETMNPTTIGMIVFTCTFGGAMLGMWLRTTLPKHHLDADSKKR